MFTMQTICNSCEGEGKTIKHLCPKCSGTGQETRKVRETVDIPRGIYDGAALKMPGKGNYGGDLIIQISVKKSNVFKREGDNALS